MNMLQQHQASLPTSAYSCTSEHVATAQHQGPRLVADLNPATLVPARVIGCLRGHDATSKGQYLYSQWASA